MPPENPALYEMPKSKRKDEKTEAKAESETQREAAPKNKVKTVKP
jgi:hypothetical protein